MKQTIDQEKRTRVRYAMLGLVFINVMINYLDRTTISVAITSIGAELKLSSVKSSELIPNSDSI